jgi:hypothetical protein
MLDFEKMTKNEIIFFIRTYDKYIYNDGEPWNEDRQPVCINEFFDNEYQEILKPE